MSGSLQTELTAHLSGVPPLEDRPKMLVAIELLVALVSSGILFGAHTTRAACQAPDPRTEQR